MLFEEGRFKAKPVRHQMVGQGQADRRMAIEFLISDASDRAKVNNGRKITWFGSLKTTKSQEFVKKVLVVCGWDPKKQPLFTKATLDKEVVLTIENREYDGEKRSEVRYVDDPSASFGIDLDKFATDPDEADKLAQELAEVWAANGAGDAGYNTAPTHAEEPAKPAAKAPAKSAASSIKKPVAAGAPSDEDIPFMAAHSKTFVI